MKTLTLLLLLLMYTIPLYADQALVLTEIEQLQEKIWYLQRDVAAQKAALAQQQKQREGLAAKFNQGQTAIDEKLARLTQEIADQREKTQHADSRLQELQEALASLGNAVSQQTQTMQSQAETSGSQVELLKELRKEMASNQALTDQALAATRTQLDETRKELEALRRDDGRRNEQLALWGGGAALLLAILLTVAAIVRSSRSRQQAKRHQSPPRHEL